MSAKPNKAAEPAAAETSKKAPSLIVVALISAIAAGVVGGGVAWFVGGKVAATASSSDEHGAESKTNEKEKKKEKQKEAPPPAPAKYYALTPPFVVNLNGERGAKYLQIELQVVTRDEEAFAQIKTHEPALRNALLLLFSQQEANALTDRGGKEALQQAALKEVQRVMQVETGKPSVESLLFTSFVMQ